MCPKWGDCYSGRIIDMQKSQIEHIDKLILKQEQSKVANFERLYMEKTIPQTHCASSEEQALQNERAGYTTVNSREHEERFAPGGSSNIESTYRTVIPIELDQVENLSG
eukprot:jgi/Bigna1/71437/fgenesh1_pg.15_\